ncbi:MAG TPA: DUF4430 domain-containing protein [Patescibacteria group bacterium]|nr:DUF4430 domain-containing protein [Patescibacteria group bacterium]
MFNKSNHSVLTIFIALAVILGGGIWAYTSYGGSTTPSQATVASARPQSRTRTEISYTAKPNLTSLAQLKTEADDVVIKDSQYGNYVDSIESHKGGSEGGKYWSFYINGKLATAGADSYTQKGGEKIVWKFQKL